MKFKTMALFLAALILRPDLVLANEKAESKHKKMAVEIIEVYSKAKGISADIEKTDEKITLGTKSISQGQFKYSKGKVYLLLKSDKQAELFYKNGKMTLVDYPDQDFDKAGVRKITHFNGKEPDFFLKSLTTIFSNANTFFLKFKIIDSSLQGDILRVSLRSAQQKPKELKLQLDVKNKRIESIRFTDDVNTNTTIVFSNLKLKKAIPNADFEFKPLKTDQEVTP